MQLARKKKTEAQLEAEQKLMLELKEKELLIQARQLTERNKQEFADQAQIQVELSSAFGINDSYQIGGVLDKNYCFGPQFDFLRDESNFSEANQIVFAAGRQIVTRNLDPVSEVQLNNHHEISENFVHNSFIPVMEKPLQRITCIKSQEFDKAHIVAVACNYLEDPEKLVVNFYNNLKTKSSSIHMQFEIKLPKTKTESSVSENDEKKKPEKEGHQCHYHSKKKAQTNEINEKPKACNHEHGLHTRSFVSHMAFSQNMIYFACLISGPYNGIVIYNLRDFKREIFTQIWFTDGTPTFIEPQVSLPKSMNKNISSNTYQSTKAAKPKKVYPQVITGIEFSSNMSEISLTGPNGHFGLYKVNSPEITQIVEDEQPFVKQFQKFLSPTCLVMQSWNELVNKEIHNLFETDGKIIAICSDQGHLCAAINECIEGEEPICLMTHYNSKSFCDLKVTQKGLIASTFKCELFFFELISDMDHHTFQEIRRWSLFDNVSFLEPSLLESVFVRGIKTLLDPKKQVSLAVQLSNRNIMLIDLESQVFSVKKKEDLQAKIDEFEVLKKTKLANEVLVQISKKDAELLKDKLEHERKVIMDMDFKFLSSGFHSGAITELHTCDQRSVVLTCSLEDNTVRLWNYLTNNCDFVKNFTRKTATEIQKPLRCCALHPSGYYMAVALTENMSVYHILHNELRQFHTYEQKNIQQLKFSSGGQTLISVDQKNMIFYSTYTLEKLKVIQCVSNQISCLAFNEIDSQMSLISHDGFFQRYSQLVYGKEGDQDLCKTNQYMSCVYLPNKKEVKDKQNNDGDQQSDRMLVVGQDSLNGGALLTIFDGRDDKFVKNPVIYTSEEYDEAQDIVETFRMNDMCIVNTPKHQIKNLVVATNRGTLRILNLPEKRTNNLQDERFLKPQFIHQTVFPHSAEACGVKSSVDGKYIFSIGLDGVMFVYKVKEANIGVNSKIDTSASSARKELAQKKQETEVIPKGMITIQPEDQVRIDQEMASIVLVSRSKMEKWRREQERLKNEMEDQSNKVESNLRSRRYSFEQRRGRMEKEMTERLGVLNKQYSDLQMAEAEQKDNNTQQMKNMEITHNKCKEELQELYEKKLEFEKQQFRILKKEQEEMRKIKEQEIRMLNLQQEQDIELLLETFKTNLQTVQENYEKSKRYGDSLKMKNEEKLTSQEQDQNEEISEIKRRHVEEITKLDKTISDLKQSLVSYKWQTVQYANEEAQYNEISKNLDEIMSQLKKKEKEQNEQKSMLENEKKDVQKNLKKKETELYRQKFKIKDLQKTKQVLTHLTQEVKASLEPREQQIEALKDSLKDYEKTFASQASEIKRQSDNATQRDQQIKNLIENIGKEKKETKKQEKKIQEFVSEINKIVQEKDENAYITGLMKIYKKNVKDFADEIIDKKKKDPETIDELDRQLKYMERSINQLKQVTSKSQQKTKQNIKKRTGENKDLIDELSMLRQQEDLRRKSQEDLDKKINEKNQKKRRLETEIKKLQDQLKRAKLNKDSQTVQPEPSQLFTRPKTGQQNDSDAFKRSQSRGKLIKGPLFNSRPAGVYKQKIAELMAQLEENNQTILLQNLHIATLKDDFFAAVRDHQEITQQQQQQFAQMQQELESMNVQEGEQDQSYMHQLNQHM